MKAESRPARGARAVGRIIVFILGTVWGVLAAMILTSYPVNGPAVVRHFAIWSTLLLGLAGPVCWYLAAHTEVGDRWTLGYFLAWVGWFVLAASRKRSFEVGPSRRVGRRLGAGSGGWAPNPGLRLESLRDLIELYGREVEILDRRIHMTVKDDRGYKAVQAIHSVGPVLAAVFVAEIGDVGRFPSADHLETTSARVHRRQRRRHAGSAAGLPTPL